VTPNDCRRQPLIFKQVNTFLAPLLDCYPQRPGLDPPLVAQMYFTVAGKQTAVLSYIGIGV